MTFVRVLLRSVVVLAACLPALDASDFTGVYAKIDRVVIENETVQIWGVFAAAKPDDRNDYLPPARGYLYFKAGTNPQLAHNEWNDLKQAAGTGEVMAFGNRPFTARLRKSSEKAENPDSYPVNTGVVRVRGRTGYPPVRSVLEFKD